VEKRPVHQSHWTETSTDTSSNSSSGNNTDANYVVDCMSLALDRRDLESAILALDREKCVIFCLLRDVTVIVLVEHLCLSEILRQKTLP